MSLNKEYTAGIYTLGCKVNQYESEAIAEELEKHGIRIAPPSSVCDAYIINTCTVTAESDRKARQFIRRVISKNPSAYVIVTGCLAQTSPEAVGAIDGVDAVIGNSEKLLSAKVLLALFEKGEKNAAPQIFVDDIDEAGFEGMAITKFDRTRAYVKIEDGCENKCTYCIIPYARGKVRSKDPDELLYEVRALVRGGCREIVLTGIETASYGKDLGGVDLADILCRIDKIEGIGRVRLGSLDPSLIRPDFVKKIASLSCLAPHFHLSLQSGSDKVLALMKRKYNSRMAMNAINLLREYIPDVKFTTDVIVGFPEESEEDFFDTARFVAEAGFLMVHIFPYSKREGTPAAKMQCQIPNEEKSRRLHALEKIAAESRLSLLEREVAERPCREVLFETYSDGYAHGHTDDFLEVSVKSGTPLRSETRRVRLEHTDGKVCFGVLEENI
ncbi:MAG: tRNA (N(6)-L-threonylcarbamoyladenosine(37)-C(2))-methylthiotransferase MtaB [Clostridia bacterium]|nr:tRNA (N(6)-L-threonylcarbamoyladenosine(37)-C(2))-methylthiotransferase MtaB [Clostridia bacterium]